MVGVRSMFSRPVRDQKGQLFLLVLILMLVSSLIIVPLISYMYSARVATERNEDRFQEQYSADAGIEYGMELLQQKDGLDPPLPLNNGDKASYTAPNENLNDRVVGNTWIICEDIGAGLYRIKASAVTTLPSTPGTSIDSLVRLLTVQDFLDKAITSRGDVTLKPGSQVIGRIWVETPPGTLDDKSSNPGQHPQDNEPVVGWPTDENMITFYKNDVANAPPWPYGNPVQINNLPISNPNIIGPNYHEGDLAFNNKSSVRSVYFDNTTATPGTLYVNGNIDFAQPSKAYTIYLNGQTIFATGDITFAAQKVNLVGPGAIIALGDVEFQPQISGSGFIFVMSLNGHVTFKPKGDFYGSVAGDVWVDLWPNCQFTWSEPTPILNVPWDKSDRNIIAEIVTWDIGSFNGDEPMIITPSLPDAGFNVPYVGSLTGRGGKEPYTWDNISGDWPPGLELDHDTGAISGVPTTVGQFTFEVELQDAASNSVTRNLSITVRAVTIITTGLNVGHVGFDYTGKLMATGLAPPFTWSNVGNLPPGLALDPGPAIETTISGNATTAGTYSFQIVATDTVSNTDSKMFSITIHTPATVTTGLATGVSLFSATLNGTLDSLGSENGGVVYFEWWDVSSDNYTPQQPTSSTGSFAVTLTTLDGLQPNTEYRFKIWFLANDGMKVCGLESSFKTD